MLERIFTHYVSFTASMDVLSFTPLNLIHRLRRNVTLEAFVQHCTERCVEVVSVQQFCPISCVKHPFIIVHMVVALANYAQLLCYAPMLLTALIMLHKIGLLCSHCTRS